MPLVGARWRERLAESVGAVNVTLTTEQLAAIESAVPKDSRPQRAYFNGYALWTYLTSPFLLALPGFSVRRFDPVEHDGTELTGLQFEIPPGFTSHSRLQESTSDPTCCWLATITASTWPVGSRRSSTFRVSSRQTAFGCRRSGAPTGAAMTAEPTSTSSWCRLTCPASASHSGNPSLRCVRSADCTATRHQQARRPRSSRRC
jgi:hypothetical protein